MRSNLRSGAVLLTVGLQLFVIAYFAAYFGVMQKWSEENRREENARRLIANFQNLAGCIDEATRGIKQFAGHDVRGLRRFDEASVEAKKAICEMRFDGDNLHRTAFKRLADTCDKLVDRFNEVRRDAQSLDSISMLIAFGRLEEQIQPEIKEIKEDGLVLMEEQNAILNQGPSLQKKRYESALVLLIGGLVGSFLLSGLVLAIFWRCMIARLERILENSKRAAANKPLLARLKGKDELASLDDAFHNLVEELKEAQFAQRSFAARLEESEACLVSIIQMSESAISICDESGCIEDVNSPWCALFGFERTELVGRSLQSLLNPEDGNSGAEGIHSLLKQLQGDEVRMLAVRKDGHQFPVDLVFSAYTASSGQRLVVSIRNASGGCDIKTASVLEMRS